MYKTVELPIDQISIFVNNIVNHFTSAMKSSFSVILFLLLFSFTSNVFAENTNRSDLDINGQLQSNFANPPKSVQTTVYWYWISNNISKEGVVQDLQAMKKAGINRAFIGNIGIDEVPYGKVKMLSDEWWDILHTALKTATELDIEIGIFNSPGWSQSGGPWIKAENAMRYLASSELRIKGPTKMNQKLIQPNREFQDVKVIAYPAPKNDLLVLNATNSRILSQPTIDGLEKLIDGDVKTGLNIPSKDSLIIDFESIKDFTARSLTIRTTKEPITAQAQLQVKTVNGYKTISSFEINRSKADLNVGFDPYAPIVISIPATTSKAFRLIIKNSEIKQFAGANLPEIVSKSGLTEIALSVAPRIERYSEKTLAKMYQLPLPYWNEYQWEQQPKVDDASSTIDASKVIDISKYMAADGTLIWNVPKGDWVILRTGMTPTGTKNGPAAPEATGYEVDKLSAKQAEKHFEGHIGEILKRIPEADRKTFKVVVQDSYETGGQNFTDDFFAEFKKAYGYDALPFLPTYYGYVVGSYENSDRFLWDLRRFVADRVAYQYVGGLRDISHKHGLTTWLECYGHWGFPGEFLQYGGQSDEISGEFWSKGTLGDIENRAATSCGHIYGKTKISSESFTVADKAYCNYPATLKQRGDRFFAEGINNTLLHVFISQAYPDKFPGVNSWFGNEFDAHNTWFSQIDIFTQYLKRCNYMLQQGLNVADVAYFIGEDTPKMTGITDPALPKGYQFDYINAEVIEKSMTVKDNLLTLNHGTQFKILVLPKLETMRPELLTKIQQLVLDGAVVLGPAPNRSPSLQNQPQADFLVKKLSKELWGEVDGLKVKFANRGKGIIMSGLTMEEALAQIDCIPDCKIPENVKIDYNHRKMSDGDCYFISNQSDKEQIASLQFRVKGMQPELWDAVTGANRKLPAFLQEKESTTVPIKLAANESAFIVFKSECKPTSTEISANYPTPRLLTTVQVPWKVTFDAKVRTPKHITMSVLKDLTTFDNDSIKYFSGIASYTATFSLEKLPKNERIFVNLNNVGVMAKVSINGNYVGGVWTAPYKLDVSNFISKGSNSIQVDVVNTWVNRLIGDQKLPKAQRQTWTYFNPYKADSPLQPSGLVGPVEIESINYIR